jgi:hypothetical protein
VRVAIPVIHISSWFVVQGFGSASGEGRSGAASAGPAAACLLFQGFDGDGQGDVVADMRRVLAGVELGALDPGAGIGAQGILLDDRVGHGLEGTEAQGDRPGDALDGEQAFDGYRLVAVKLDGGGLVGDGRVLRGIEEVFALEVLVEQRITGIDRPGVDDDVDRAGLRGAVEDDGAGSLVEALNLVRVPEMVVFEARVGVVRVDQVGFRGGERRGGEQAGEGDEADCFFMGWLLDSWVDLLADCCRGSDDVELDLDFVGDGADVGPDAVADTEIEAFQDEGAVEDAVAAVLAKS